MKHIRLAVVALIATFFALSVHAGQPQRSITLNPTSGVDAGGTTVTITGSNTNFVQGTTGITFGSTAATGVTVSSTTSLTCVTPVGTGMVDVTATTGAEIVVKTGGFSYQAGGGGSSAFRFLTQSLVRATRSSAYSQTLVVANAAGEVTFAIAPGSEATLASLGLALDTKTGLISGIIPSGAGNASGDPVSFTANDGTTTITLSTSISTTSAGGSDFGFSTASLPTGEIESPYTTTVQVVGGSFATSGLTLIRFGATDLPAGLSMNGLTGVISGTPSAAGTFYVTVTATDQSNNNKAVVVLALLVFPKASTFKFNTVILDNGEVGLAYAYALLVSGGSGNGNGIKYSASGLPAGLDIDVDTGVIAGTPTSAGTFIVNASATKGNETITINRPIVIVPVGTNFYWFFNGGLPTAFLNQPYSPTSPPITLLAHPFTSITYSPPIVAPGVLYSTTGEFSGTPTEPGIYPVTFMATDSATGAIITFSYEFVVLPPNGGDTNSLPINLWVKKMSFKRGNPGKDSWQAQWIYNADRRQGQTPARIYDESTDPIVLSLGSIPEVSIPRASLVGSRPKFTFKATNQALKLDESSQSLMWSQKGLTINDRGKTTLKNIVKLGTKAYRLDLFFDDKGKFTPALGYRKTAFVVASAKVGLKGVGKDSASFSMLLGDPSFVFPSLADNKTARFRLLNSAGTVLVDKDFTSIVTSTVATDSATGAKVYKLKSGKDATSPVGKFSYDSKSGKLTVALKSATIAGLSTAEEHVSIELVVAEKQYFTAVTLFAPKAGSYSTKLP